ncbi:MAG: (2Fe-2S)-binding protein, partial [Candidatus Thermoplasmatota archaeon]
GNKVQVDAVPDTPLLWVLRDTVGLTGTKYGCGIAQCGACTVHVGDRAVRSCSLPVSAVGNARITTIEGLAAHGRLHPLQEAFRENHGLQCGFCTPGVVLAASELLRVNPKPTEEEIRVAISGNLCRCTGYVNIVKSVSAAASRAGGG